MAGQHRYSSSLFIQSGSVAQFKSGITSSEATITGDVFASGYFDLDGNPVSSGGGSQAVFFAGTGSGISQSNPVSQDHFFTVEGDLSFTDYVDPNNPNPEPIVTPGTVKIETTSSVSFTPNFFNFLKVGNNGQDLITVQQGENPTYVVDNIDTQLDELKPGTHRYIIYAADTNPGGSTHQVFHTVTLKAFVNEPPNLQIPIKTEEEPHLTMSLDHDNDSKDFILFFTNSTDPNQELGEADFLKEFSASRTALSNPTVSSDTDESDGYTLTLKHTTTEEQTIDGKQTITTQSLDPGLAEEFSPGALHFTASLTNYTAINGGNVNTIVHSTPQTESFFITLKDNYPTAENPGITTGSVTMSIVPPPTSSISDIKILFSGSGNSGVDSGQYEFSHTHVILYDRTQSLNSTEMETETINERYTSSIIKITTTASITEPPGFVVVPENHTTRISIQSSSNTTFDSSGKKIGTFLISGSSTNENLTSSHYSPTINGTYISLDDNGFFDLTESIDITTKSDRNIYYGASTNNTTLNSLSNVKHGNHDHYRAFTHTPDNAHKLTLQACPEILIKNIAVEVESGSFATNEGNINLTSSLLYNLTSSITTPEVSSIFSNFVEGLEPFNQYVSQSIVRLRIKCNVIEPFGPDHKSITASFKVTGDNTSTVGGTSNTFEFSVDNDNAVSNDSNMLGALNSDSVNDFINLTSFFALDGVTDLTTIDSISVTKIELRGDLGTQQSGTERIKDFQCGGIFFGDNNYVSSTTPSNFGDSNSPVDTDSATFTIGWEGTQPVSLNSDGTIDVSYDPDSGVNYNPSGMDNAYEIKITFSYDVVTGGSSGNEFIPEFEDIIFHFNTSSADHFGYTLNHGYDQFNGKKLLTSSYTSSFVEFKQLAGVNTFQAHFTSQSNAGTILDTENSQSAIVSMSAVEPTRIENLVYEVESHGYSETAATGDTIRTILYGNSHVTNNGTGSLQSGESWATHTSASIFASHSVSRFRVRGKFVEPAGPSTGQLDINLIYQSVGDSSNYSATNDVSFKQITINPDHSTTNPITDSGDISSSVSVISDPGGQLITTFTSSWIGKEITLEGSDRNVNGSQQFTISGSLSYTPDTSLKGGDNTLDIIDPTFNTITVKQTPPTIIDRVEIQSETFGYSEVELNNVSRTVLYGDAHFTHNGTGSSDTGVSWGRLGTNDIPDNLSDVYASHSVSRYKVKATIIEPLGPLHEGTLLTLQQDGSNLSSPFIFLTTGSSLSNNVQLNDRERVDNPALANHIEGYSQLSTYTSSFIGEQFTISNGSTTQTINIASTVTHHPSGEVAATTNTNISTDLTIIDTLPAEINDVIVETETHGYSDVFTTNPTTRTVLYGDNNKTNDGTGSLESGESWATQTTALSASVFASHSVSRYRVKFKVVEPIGPFHHSSSISKRFLKATEAGESPVPVENFNTTTFNSNSLEASNVEHFNVGGTNVNSNRLIYTITSSLVGQQLTGSSAVGGVNTTISVTSADVSHEANNEQPENYSSIVPSIITTVFDTPPTIIDNIFFETEELGLNGVVTNNATRTVLYGDNHITNADTNPLWASHPEATKYNEISVTRLRVRGRVTEPIGPVHHDTQFIPQLTSTPNNNFLFVDNVGGSGYITFNSNSSNTTRDVVEDRLVLNYTSSFFGVQLTSNELNGETYTFFGQVGQNSSDGSGHTQGNVNTSTIVVLDTPKTNININSVDIETKGESNIASAINPSNSSFDSQHTRILLLGNSLTVPTGSLIANEELTGSAVLRTRITSTITEPIGPLHYGATMSVLYDASGGPSNDRTGPNIGFSTNSADVGVPSPSYVASRLETTYVSVFTGSAIPAQSHYLLDVTSNEVLFTPPTENGFTLTSTGRGNNFITVNAGIDPSIENFFIEVEDQKSGSGDGNRVKRNTFVLHGMTGSETDVIAQNLAPLSQRPQESKEQLVNIRVLATFNQPPSAEHQALNIDVKKFFAESNKTITDPLTVTAKSLTLTTGSTNTDVFSFNNPPIEITSAGTVIHYTSSFFPVLFNAQGNTNENLDSLTTTFPVGTEISSKIHSDPFVAPAGQENIEGTLVDFPEIEASTGGGGTLFPSENSIRAIRIAYYNNINGTSLPHGSAGNGESSVVEIDLGTVDGVNTALHNFTGYVKLKKIEISGDLDGGTTNKRIVGLLIGIKDIDNSNVIFFKRMFTDSGQPIVKLTGENNNGTGVLKEVWNSEGSVPDPHINGHRFIGTGNQDIINSNFHFDEVPVRNGKIQCSIQYLGNDVHLNPANGFGVRMVLTVETLEDIEVESTNESGLNNIDNSEKAKYTLSASVSNVVSDVDSTVIFTPASPLITSNTVDVFVSGALSSSIVSPLVTGSLISASVFDSSNEKFLYVIYPNNGNATEQIQLHTNPIVFPPDIEHEFQDDVGVITSESVLVFPNNLDISVTSSNDRFSFDGSGTLTDNPTNGTASIFITNPNNYSNVITSSLITLTIVDKEVGEGFLVLKTSMSVIPAPPADMTGDFGSFTILGHPAGKQNRFYTGSLVSESLINYSESKGPINPGFGSYTDPFNLSEGRFVTSSRIIYTSQSDGSQNYDITFNTHASPAVYSGDYNTANKAYSYGDTGSLEVKLNGETQFIAYLQHANNFVNSDKNGDQDMNGYDHGGFTNGTASFSSDNGQLLLNRVSPFNGVSQSISASGIILSNGYQGWEATINITDKPRDGYNYLELIHNITSSLTQSLNVFDWYYDDGFYTSSLESTGNFITMSNAPSFSEPTHSISGISYFKVDSPVSASINLIHHLASKTYPSDESTGFKNMVVSIPISGNLDLKGDGSGMSSGKLQHRTFDIDILEPGSNFRRGLRYHEDDGNYIPTSKSTGSILYHIESSDNPTGTDRDGGIIHGIRVMGRQKDPSDLGIYLEKELGQKLIGRFMTSGSDISGYEAKTDQIETFFDEDRRWSRSSLEDLSIVRQLRTSDPLGYSFFLSSSNADYNSNQSIVATDDLQQTYEGILKYPSKNYSVDGGGNLIYNNFHQTLPNYDILTSNSNRYYYTALRFNDSDFDSNTLGFKVRVHGNFNENDIFGRLGQGIGVDDSKIRVDIKIPGPQTNAAAGSGWSNIGHQGSNTNTLTDDWSSFSSLDNQLSASDFIEFTLNMRNRRINKVDGVVLFRVRYKNTVDEHITKLEILPL